MMPAIGLAPSRFYVDVSKADFSSSGVIACRNVGPAIFIDFVAGAGCMMLSIGWANYINWRACRRRTHMDLHRDFTRSDNRVSTRGLRIR